jgi:MoaA/NifB/PqqE/SkfB family radical SAM enzyme
VYLCCPGWGRLCIGSAFESSLLELWQNERAMEIRRSIFDGDFRSCYGCPYTPAPWNVIVPASEFMLVPDRIPRLTLAYDRTCNLLCPTCRSRSEVSPHAGPITDRLLQPGFLNAVDRLKFLGSGEPLVAPTFWRFVSQFPWQSRLDLRVKLHTNARLFTPACWARISALHDHIDEVFVSIDAATPTTYAQNRPGAKPDERAFETLVTNLHFIASLKLRRFVLGFVVQANNYQEMPDFVDLGVSVGATAVRFTKLRSWATGFYFQARSVLPADSVQILREVRARGPFVELEHFAGI